MVKELLNNESFTFNQWCKIYLYNDWINYVFKGISNEERKHLLNHTIENKVKLYRP
jgi:hypothetical protein